MNLLLAVGLLLIIGYTAGWLLEKIGIPKIVGYIATGVAFSPNNMSFIGEDILNTTQPLMQVCLSFIAFEIGGALLWSKIKKHEKEIINITILASVFPFMLIAGGIFILGILFPTILPFDPINLMILGLLFGALASPTDPTATFAVMHQYKAKGKLTDTILGIAALDDVLGIFLFSITISGIYIFAGIDDGNLGNPVLQSIYHITVAILIGIVAGFCIDLISRFIPKTGEGQWVVIVFSLIIFCTGVTIALGVDSILAAMTMGVVVVNTCTQQKDIFRILQRYTEDLIILFFFLMSGLYLELSTLYQATFLIMIFVLLRTAGKYWGANVGARLAKADKTIRKYTAGGLLPQGGIVIGLVLNVYQNPVFEEISGILLTTIMGTTIIHEIIGPVIAKRSLMKAGEI